MSLDELIAKAIRRGIDEVGWKGQLARFLDLEVRCDGILLSVIDRGAGHRLLFWRPDWQQTTSKIELPWATRRSTACGEL